MSCYCGHGESYETCCQPYHSGTEIAPTPEALMRSRYSAYSAEQIQYLEQTHHPRKREEFDPEAARAWASESKWLGLEIVLTEDAGEDEGYVEFKARYTRDGTTITHHERSRFVKIDGRWYYDDGRMLAEPVKRAGPKVGRNEPCPCGSGKKYKKCCGR